MLKKTSRAFRLSRGQTSIGFPRGRAVANQHYVILKGSDLDGPPGDFFNHARVPLRADRDHVANLKRPIGLQRNAGEEISQRVLKRKTQDDAEDR